jgi:hypothetical protein
VVSQLQFFIGQERDHPEPQRSEELSKRTENTNKGVDQIIEAGEHPTFITNPQREQHSTFHQKNDNAALQTPDKQRSNVVSKYLSSILSRDSLLELVGNKVIREEIVSLE